MNILVLHGMGHPSSWLMGVADIELMFPRYDKKNKYLVHSGRLPLPDNISSFPFSAVVMMSTFMDRVVQHGLSGRWIEQYEFLKNTDARKIVFPQDDYWHCNVRDQFYVEWKIDEVFPVCPSESWGELIPKSLSNGLLINQGYTTYVTPYILNISKHAPSWAKRNFDIVYRGSRIPTAPNHLGMIKSEIGRRFEKAIGHNSSLKLDLGLGSKDMVVGSAWHDFVGNSRAILGSNSGSSIRLKDESIARKINEYQLKNPNASVKEVELNTLSADDRNKNYTAISPRNIEAAILGTLQILVDGSYSGIMKADDHYIPIDEDCKNIRQILNMLKDEASCSRIIDSCRSRIIKTKELNVENLIQSVLSRIELHNLPQRYDNKFDKQFERLIIDYDSKVKRAQKIEQYSVLFKRMIRRLLGNYLTNWIKVRLFR